MTTNLSTNLGNVGFSFDFEEETQDEIVIKTESGHEIKVSVWDNGDVVISVDSEDIWDNIKFDDDEDEEEEEEEDNVD